MLDRASSIGVDAHVTIAASTGKRGSQRELSSTAPCDRPVSQSAAALMQAQASSRWSPSASRSECKFDTSLSLPRICKVSPDCHKVVAKDEPAAPPACSRSERVHSSALLGPLIRVVGREGQVGEVDWLLAGLAAAGPALEDRLHQQHGLRECQSGRG